MTDAARELIEQSKREERLAMLGLSPEGPPIRVRQLARLAGISKTKVLADGRGGEVVIRWIKCGTRKMGVVDRRDAGRYLVNLGII